MTIQWRRRDDAINLVSSRNLYAFTSNGLLPFDPLLIHPIIYIHGLQPLLRYNLLSSAIMAANATSHNGLPSHFSFRQGISVIKMELHMTPEAAQRYSDLWNMLAARQLPSEHLGLIMTVVTLARLHSSFANNIVARTLVRTFVESKQIAGLRAALPRLPDELAAVIPNLFQESTHAITMLPAMPAEFSEIFSLSANDETALRRELIHLEPKLKPAISISDDEFNIIVNNLPDLPPSMSGTWKIPLEVLSTMIKENQGLSDKLGIFWNVLSYQDWFAVYNATSFFEGLTKFATAIAALDGNESQVYWDFYCHFLRVIVARPLA